MISEENLTKEELIELVVPRVWVNYVHSTNSLELTTQNAKRITQNAKRKINKSILLKLRRMDYFSRDRLHTFMGALLGEQERTRNPYKESLYRLVSEIDQLEKEIKEKTK